MTKEEGERIAVLEEKVSGLEEMIDQRIKQEDRVQEQLFETLKARLGGEYAKIKALFDMHCIDQNARFDRLDNSLGKVHGRIDKLMRGEGVSVEQNVEQNVGSKTSKILRLEGAIWIGLGTLAGLGITEIIQLLKGLF